MYTMPYGSKGGGKDMALLLRLARRTLVLGGVVAIALGEPQGAAADPPTAPGYTMSSQSRLTFLNNDLSDELIRAWVYLSTRHHARTLPKIPGRLTSRVRTDAMIVSLKCGVWSNSFLVKPVPTRLQRALQRLQQTVGLYITIRF